MLPYQLHLTLRVTFRNTALVLFKSGQ